jgi:hypothetical protein
MRLNALFLGFLGLMAALTVGLVARYAGFRVGRRLGAGLLAWLLYVGLIGYLGVATDISSRPPGAVFLFGPLFVVLTYFVVRGGSDWWRKTTSGFPLWILMGTQAFRVIVELFLHQLWQIGLVPKMLTFSGANVDIYVGITAPVVAWLCRRVNWGNQLALMWNVLGLLALANVFARAVLTSPGPLNLIRTEAPDRMIGTFPYIYIPGFFVPLAFVLHVLALRTSFAVGKPSAPVRG